MITEDKQTFLVLKSFMIYILSQVLIEASGNEL
jgi:hypothetical protein